MTTPSRVATDSMEHAEVPLDCDWTRYEDALQRLMTLALAGRYDDG